MEVVQNGVIRSGANVISLNKADQRSGIIPLEDTQRVARDMGRKTHMRRFMAFSQKLPIRTPILGAVEAQSMITQLDNHQSLPIRKKQTVGILRGRECHMLFIAQYKRSTPCQKD